MKCNRLQQLFIFIAMSNTQLSHKSEINMTILLVKSYSEFVPTYLNGTTIDHSKLVLHCHQITFRNNYFATRNHHPNHCESCMLCKKNVYSKRLKGSSCQPRMNNPPIHYIHSSYNRIFPISELVWSPLSIMIPPIRKCFQKSFPKQYNEPQVNVYFYRKSYLTLW